MQVIGTAGHVDHGKSTLVERLTGIDPDRFAEEKRRGLTIDLGFAWLPLPSGREVGLIDVPGHERFIKNMLAGAGGISVCLMVVAANEGWMPQSAEHLAIIDLLSISSGVIALTKADTVDAETLEIAVAEVSDHIEGTSLEGVPIVPCSAVTGEGIDDLIRAIDRAVVQAPPIPDVGRPRLWVDRVFTISGAGTVVTGTLMGGSFAVGDEVEIAPEGRRARIRGIQSHKRSVAAVGPGNRTALNLSGLQRQAARRGDAVVKPGAWRSTARLDAVVRVVRQELSGSGHAVSEKGAYLLYAGSSETPVKLKLLADDAIRPGESGPAQIYLRDALPLGRGDRFVLRDAGRILTFGGGWVLDPLAPPARRKDSRRIALLQRLQRSSDDDALSALVQEEGRVSIEEAQLRSGSHRIPPGVERLGASLFSSERAGALRAAIREGLTAHHSANPLERGMPREALRAETGLSAADFDELLHGMDDVVEEGPVVRLSSHSVRLDPAQERLQEELIGRIEANGFSPPTTSELAVDPALLRALTDQGRLVRVGDFYLTAAQAAEARARVRQLIEDKGPVTVSEVRDLLGTSRRYAVPLCEWLDSTGATRRRGDVRELGPKP